MPTVFGVDFSGALQAGRKIWIARGLAAGTTLEITSCTRAAELPNSTADRAQSLQALRSLIAGTTATFGIDVPFSLPLGLLDELPWEQFIGEFAVRYPTADAFRAACVAAANGRELKRQTDRATGTPFAAYNLRLYRQTYYGVSELLAPLILAGQARGLPFQLQNAQLPSLVEICPAATLKREHLYRPYKGRGPALRLARAQLLAALTPRFGLMMSAGLREQLLTDHEGDALDSVIAACAVARSLGDLPPRDDRERREGRVYT